VTLIFEGENELIDRRAMVFTGKKRERKSKDEGEAPAGDAAGEDTTGEAAPADDQELSEPAPGAEDDTVSDEPDPDGEIKEKPGGCGCRLHETSGSNGAALGLSALLGLALLRRRLKPTNPS
jgi:MYXO-CTERM domain-containing protein